MSSTEKLELSEADKKYFEDLVEEHLCFRISSNALALRIACEPVAHESNDSYIE